MHRPFTPSEGPFGDLPHSGAFGFVPPPHVIHQARRHARRELRAQLRSHDAGHCGPAGFGPGGPGFGPGGPGFGFGPGGPGFGFGPGPRGGRRGRGHGPGRPSHRGHRGRRGDVRAAILTLLAEEPMHGYQMIQQIGERTAEVWRPSPGSVYPTLQLLVDEGLITASETEGNRRLFELTEEGRAAAEKIDTPPWQDIADCVDPGQVSLRQAVGQLFGALAQSEQAATAEQQQRIVDIVNNARREVYGILGETD